MTVLCKYSLNFHRESYLIYVAVYSQVVAKRLLVYNNHIICCFDNYMLGHRDSNLDAYYPHFVFHLIPLTALAPRLRYANAASCVCVYIFVV